MKIVLSFDVPSKEYVDYERLLSRIRRLAVDALIDEKNDVLRETDKKERIDLVKEYDKSIDSIVVRGWTYE